MLGPWRRRGSEAHAAPPSATASRVSSARCGQGTREKRRVMDPGPRTRRLPCSTSSASRWARGGQVGSATRERRGARVAGRTAELGGCGGGRGRMRLASVPYWNESERGAPPPPPPPERGCRGAGRAAGRPALPGPAGRRARAVRAEKAPRAGERKEGKKENERASVRASRESEQARARKLPSGPWVPLGRNVTLQVICVSQQSPQPAHHSGKRTPMCCGDERRAAA